MIPAEATAFSVGSWAGMIPVSSRGDEPVWLAGRVVAERVYPHLARHLLSPLVQAGATAILPDSEVIGAIVDAAFWASLRREEGYAPRISLAYVSPQDAVNSVRLQRSLLLAPHALSRLAPAVERPGIHLGVWLEDGQLRVWGATRKLPPLAFVLE